ncbi:hypothetical protein GGX14DRAFT_403656 [Mycena pura]|uniref:Uncharacterized protein n=1 Tax=Mycena pura TaxID=153505 RepID=A0AAD6UVL2_9AGAR|nr:hypothetical protein GGX14DRAFT_403656 [Mycena pura]
MCLDSLVNKRAEDVGNHLGVSSGSVSNKAWLMLSIQFHNILVYTSEGVRARRCIILSSEECIKIEIIYASLNKFRASALSIAASSLPGLGDFLFAYKSLEQHES